MAEAIEEARRSAVLKSERVVRSPCYEHGPDPNAPACSNQERRLLARTIASGRPVAMSKGGPLRAAEVRSARNDKPYWR